MKRASNMLQRKPISAAATRWGMLLTTVTLGSVLVGMGLFSYFAARRTAQDVIRARSLDMSMAVRREVVRGESGLQAALEDVLSDMEEQGLQAISIVTQGRGVIAQAGEPSTQAAPAALLKIRPGMGPKIVHGGERVRVVVPFGHRIQERRERIAKRRGRGDGSWANKRGGVRSNERRAARRFWKNRGKASRRWDRGDESRRPGPIGVMVLEFEPVVARAIQRRAFAMLLVSIAAASVLFAVAIFFWRASRKAELMGEQIEKDRRLKALGEMSAVLGHELRNPLAALKGHSQLLVEILGADHPGRKGAETVVREALRMEKLTEQILEFARTGTVECLPENPESVVRAAEEQVGSGIEVQVEEGLPEWPLDRIRIERVLINLMKNALQASPAEAMVDVSVRRAGGKLFFTVRDRGEGLPEGEEAWIFEPFHTKRVRGTGLGLAVSKRIVEAHGGEITAKNHPEGGAVFEFWLPQEAPKA